MYIMYETFLSYIQSRSLWSKNLDKIQPVSNMFNWTFPRMEDVPGTYLIKTKGDTDTIRIELNTHVAYFLLK